MGDLLSNTFSQEVAPVIRPFASGYMDGSEGVIGKNLNELIGGSDIQLSVEDSLERNPEIKFVLAENSFKDMGIYEESAKRMANDAVALTEKTGITLSNAIVDIFCSNVTYYLCFILFFVLILIIFTVLGNIFNLSFKIPEKDKLNDIGGIVAGALTGLFFCVIVVWSFKFLGKLLPEEEMKNMFISSMFMKLDLLSHFLPL